MTTGMLSRPVAPLLEQGDAVDIGHPDVEQHQIGPHALAGRTGLRSVFRQLDGVAFVGQDFREQGTDAHLVVDYKYRCHGGRVRSRWRVGWPREVLQDPSVQ
jgi:hypothetical protein